MTRHQCATTDHSQLKTRAMSNVIGITPQDLKDAFKRLRKSGIWETQAGDCKLENMDLLEKGRIVYRLSKNGNILLQGNYSKFKNLMK